MISLILAMIATSSPVYDACTAKAAGVVPALKICANREQTLRDTNLNHEYQLRLKSIDPATAAKLRTAERAWVAFRDAECAYRLADEGGGQDAALVWSDCRLELTQQRTRQLMPGK